MSKVNLKEEIDDAKTSMVKTKTHKTKKSFDFYLYFRCNIYQIL